jgi:hypothetical protein
MLPWDRRLTSNQASTPHLISSPHSFQSNKDVCLILFNSHASLVIIPLTQLSGWQNSPTLWVKGNQGNYGNPIIFLSFSLSNF